MSRYGLKTLSTSKCLPIYSGYPTEKPPFLRERLREGDRSGDSFWSTPPSLLCPLGWPHQTPSIPTDMYDMYFYDSVSAQNTLHNSSSPILLY